MNLNLKAVYYCANSGHRWGKGLTVADAKKNAGMRTKAAEKGCQFYVMAAILDNPPDKALENLKTCITADAIDGSPHYYRDNRTIEDTEMIDKYHVGWLIVEKNY